MLIQNIMPFSCYKAHENLIGSDYWHGHSHKMNMSAWSAVVPFHSLIQIHSGKNVLEQTQSS